MKIERIHLTSFRCYGHKGTTVELGDGVTAFVGANGAGKTALLIALSRMFGVTGAQRRVTAQDFHLSPDSQALQTGDCFTVDVVFSFPELAELSEDDVPDAVPEFFLQMVASEPDGPLLARMVLKATWTDDGTPDGSIEEDLRWVQTLDRKFAWDECQRVQAVQRSSIQLVYVPATRNVRDQVTSLLGGRLWQAAKWSRAFRKASAKSAEKIQQSFDDEKPARFMLERLEHRWQQVHEADTDTTPKLRLVENRFDELVRRAGFVFFPDEAGQERTMTDLSDGQRSLFHIALTAATVEAERDAFRFRPPENPFEADRLHRVHLTLLAIEEAENSLSPFFLSRIVSQCREIGAMDSVQTILSSHSPAILGRIEPHEVRYFRLDRPTRRTSVSSLTLPVADDEASRFVRLAVKAFPELYFARFVVLAEGDSERLVIPRVAEAMGIGLDQAFVPVVPLGGRFCQHFWRLLSNLDIPYATLLDLDIGRSHGGADTIRSVIQSLQDVGTNMKRNAVVVERDLDLRAVETLADADLWCDYEDNVWVQALEKERVFFSEPLDLDLSMLDAFPTAYQLPVKGGKGPRANSTKAKARTLKAGGDSTLYGNDYDDLFRWYPYLFLRRSKPETHLAALSRIDDQELARNAPPPLKSLILVVRDTLGLVPEANDKHRA